MSDTRFTHHMSDEDALMWHIEKDPILRSTILAVAVFDQPPEWTRLRARIERATRVIPRLRQRVVSPPLRLGPPRWTVEPSFDLDFHLRRLRLTPPGDAPTLLDALQPIASAAFDRARPLWEFTLFEGLEGDRAALAMKVHHSITDGVGGMELLAELVDLERDPAADPDEDVNLPAVPAPNTLGSIALVRDSLTHTSRRALGITRRFPGTVASSAFAALRDPAGAALNVTVTARSIGKLLAPATAPMSPIMRERGLGRCLAMLNVGLDDLRRTAKTTGGSLNDVFLAAVIGGLHRYHDRHGATVASLRMSLPISLRNADDDAGGNRFAPARFPVPAAVEDPSERVQQLGTLVRSWRAEPALRMTSALAGVLNRMPTATTTALFGGMLKCCDFVATNVPGAPVPVYAGGARIERMYAFAPTAGAAVNVALISHCDTCCIGVVVDTTAVPDAATLVDCLREGFEELLAIS
jgi:diacylglycerol O-acyltransferase / wax synthase